MLVLVRCLALTVALFAPLPASAAITVNIDKSAQRMTVIQDGRALYTWPVSTGKRGHATPAGSFKTFRMEKDHFSREWDDAPMPNSIFFTKQGHAIHGTNDVKRLGSPASHGCVRLSVEHSAILFAMVKADGVLNTTVNLTGVEPAYAPNVPIARAPQNQNPANQNPNYTPPETNVARGAPSNGLDNQAYSGQVYSGDDRYPAPNYPRFQQRAPIDDQRYAYENVPPPSYYRQSQPYGRPYYAPPPQPYYGSRYRDPSYNDPPPAYYRRGYGYGGY